MIVDSEGLPVQEQKKKDTISSVQNIYIYPTYVASPKQKSYEN